MRLFNLCTPALIILFLTVGARSQTDVTTGGSADSNVVYAIPIMTGSQVALSSFYQYNGNIGWGNPYPPQPLSVNGNIFAGTSVGAFMIPDYGSNNGYNQGFGINAFFDGTNWRTSSDGANNAGALIIGNHGAGDMRFYTMASTGGSWQTLTNLGSYQRMIITSSGNVGIGTGSPGSDLTSLPSPPTATTQVFEVNGDIALTQGNGGVAIFSDGSVQSTAWNGTTLGGDYAESVDVLGDRAGYEPGDVIVIDPAAPGSFGKSGKAYSRLVAGVFSTKPGLVGRRTNSARPDRDAEVPMAMMGIVPTKVSTENGAIEPGDLLVSSSTPGYAMKGTDGSRMMGAVIGKALAPLKTGSGVIELLVSLQ